MRVQTVRYLLGGVFWRTVLGTGYLLGATGIGVAVYQSVGWLRFNQWMALTVFRALDEYWGLAWLHRPQDWIGLHQLLVPTMKLMPLSGFLLGAGLLVASVGKWKLKRRPLP
ncbi:MAG: hypothetical protein ACREI3_06595, partial [Nitrospirales bacterium]